MVFKAVMKVKCGDKCGDRGAGTIIKIQRLNIEHIECAYFYFSSSHKSSWSVCFYK